MKILKDGQEFFDGQLVNLHEGRFAGAFLIEEEVGAPLSSGDQVTFLVTARVDTPKFSRIRKTGELKRSNTLRVEEAVVVDPAKARWMYDQFQVDVVGVNSGFIEAAEEPIEDSEPVPLKDSFFSEESEPEPEPEAKVEPESLPPLLNNTPNFLPKEIYV